MGKSSEVVHLHLRSVDAKCIIERCKSPVIFVFVCQFERLAVIVPYWVVDLPCQGVPGIHKTVQGSFPVVLFPSRLQQFSCNDRHIIEITFPAFATSKFDQ